MLVLSRKKNEQVSIADGLIKIRVLQVNGNRVQLGIEAPSDIRILREEVPPDAKHEERKTNYKAG